jgi:hypothetical protein
MTLLPGCNRRKTAQSRKIMVDDPIYGVKTRMLRKLLLLRLILA